VAKKNQVRCWQCGAKNDAGLGRCRICTGMLQTTSTSSPGQPAPRADDPFKMDDLAGSMPGTAGSGPHGPPPAAPAAPSSHAPPPPPPDVPLPPDLAEGTWPEAPAAFATDPWAEPDDPAPFDPRSLVIEEWDGAQQEPGVAPPPESAGPPVPAPLLGDPVGPSLGSLLDAGPTEPTWPQTTVIEPEPSWPPPPVATSSMPMAIGWDAAPIVPPPASAPAPPAPAPAPPTPPSPPTVPAPPPPVAGSPVAAPPPPPSGIEGWDAPPPPPSGFEGYDAPPPPPPPS